VINYVLSWTDPDDPDHGTSHGFDTFETKDELLVWLNQLLIVRPDIKPRAFHVHGEFFVEKVDVVKQFKLGRLL
jgi:hypothetical protein